MGKEDFLLTTEFDPTSVSDDFMLVQYGRRRTGKSTWAEWFLSAIYPRFDNIYVFTCTKFKGYFDKFVPSTNIYDGFDEDTLQLLLDKAQQIQKLEKENKLKLDYHMAVIFDDVFADYHAIRKSPAMNQMATAGRHFNMSGIINIQSIVGMTPAQRQNVDYAIIFKTSSRTAREGLHKEYGDFMSFAEFNNMMDRNAVGYRAIVVDNTTLDADKLDAYKWTVADPAPAKFFIHDSDVSFFDEFGE